MKAAVWVRPSPSPSLSLQPPDLFPTGLVGQPAWHAYRSRGRTFFFAFASGNDRVPIRPQTVFLASEVGGSSL